MTKFVDLVVAWQRRIGAWLAPFVLLGMRLLVGVCFFYTGKGKLEHLDRTTDFFTDLHIPMPHLNAIMAGSTEMIGGICLAMGLAGRLTSVPLVFTMLVALGTAHREATLNVFNEPDKFIEQAPIPFLMTVLVVLCFGPGPLSVDGLVGRWWRRPCPTKEPMATA
ncbi:MAG: DoxX family protein [Planctomycetota bacterium]|nr:DoxX family protein [Planctomycetota bacterium]